jgi:ornithine carbamoyltransferase
VGDGNNVARSLAFLCAMLGVDFVIASPNGYELDSATVGKAQATAEAHGSRVSSISDPVEAVAGCDVVYTDTWTSMGQEAEAAVRRDAFSGFQVNAALMAHAMPDAIFMHCLPAHHGEEVTTDVLNGPSSVVFDQAENRLHAQKAVLAQILIPAD